MNKFVIIVVLCLLGLGNFPVPSRAAGATMYLTPSSGTYVINGTFNVSVKVNTGGDGINAAEGKISFDNNLLDVVSVSKGGSIFPFWTTEPSFSNSAGTISFGGGLPPPAYNGTAGHIFSITFKAKKSGGAQVRFASGAVLANDGKGTNVLASMGSGSYTVSPKVTAPPPTSGNDKPTTPPKTEEPVVTEYNKLAVRSETHPDQNIWYNKKVAKFSWDLPKGATGISILLNNEPNSDPGPSSDGLFAEKEFEIEKDGVWYLHVKVKDGSKWGTITHYRIMVDTTPPLPFEAAVKEIGVGEWPKIVFETDDDDSGMDKYEVYIGSLERQAHEVSLEEKMLEVTGLHAGDHTAIVKAIDKAGNERISTVHFVIAPIPTPEITNYASEIKATDNYYMNGTALENSLVSIYLQKDGNIIATSSTRSDAGGNWIYIHNDKLPNGRYIAWVEATNDKGIQSEPSKKVSFLVSPPIFAIVGDVVINYFTVFVSLLFMIILIVLSILFIVGLLRKKLKKETVEVEEVLHKNASEMKKAINDEFTALAGIKTKTAYDEEREKVKARLLEKVDTNEKRSIKEVQDVEEILK